MCTKSSETRTLASAVRLITSAGADAKSMQVTQSERVVTETGVRETAKTQRGEGGEGKRNTDGRQNTGLQQEPSRAGRGTMESRQGTA